MRVAKVADQLKEGLKLGWLFLFLAKVRIEPLVLSVKADEFDSLHCRLVRRALINLSQCLKNLSQYLAISYDGVIPDYAELFLLLKRAFIDRSVLPPFEAEFFDPL